MKLSRVFSLLALAAAIGGCHHRSSQLFAQSYQAYQNPHVQFFSAAGAPLSGGKLCTYTAGTTTPLASYKDSSGTLNTNPVILDSGGFGTIYLSGSSAYKFILYTAGTDNTCSTGVLQWTQDNISVLAAQGLTLNGNLLWATDNANDIGATGASRPRDLWLGRNLNLGGSLTSGLTFSADNSLDIGQSGALRPRDLWLGRNLNLGGSLTSGLTFSADNSLDIGQSGALRPRDLWLGRNLNLGGSLTSGGSIISSSAAVSPSTAFQGINTAAAAPGTNEPFLTSSLCANYWTGSASAQSCWTLTPSFLGSGNYPNTMLAISANVNLPNGMFTIVDMAGVQIDTFLRTGQSFATDFAGEISLSSATTATQFWGFTHFVTHPECEITPQFDPGSGVRYWITYTSVSAWTINFSSPVTGNVSYICVART